MRNLLSCPLSRSQQGLDKQPMFGLGFLCLELFCLVWVCSPDFETQNLPVLAMETEKPPRRALQASERTRLFGQKLCQLRCILSERNNCRPMMSKFQTHLRIWIRPIISNKFHVIPGGIENQRDPKSQHPICPRSHFCAWSFATAQLCRETNDPETWHFWGPCRLRY